MAQVVIITLFSPGADTGPNFDLYSNADGFVTPFETNVSKASLVAGYTSVVVPDGATIIRVKSHGTNILCPNYIDLTIGVPTTTSTSTSSTTSTSTSTSTTTSTTTTPPPSRNLIGDYVMGPTLSCVPHSPISSVYLNNTDYAIFLGNGGLLVIGMQVLPAFGTFSGPTRIYDSLGTTIFDVADGGVITNVNSVC